MITNIQDGDTLGICNHFNIKDKNTLISPIVVEAENLGDPKGGWDKYEHIGSVIKKNGILSLGEAIEPKYHIIPLEEKLKGRNLSDFIIYRPNFKYNLTIFTEQILSMEGKPYNILDLVWQIAREATHHRLWLGSKKETKWEICSKADAQARYESTGRTLITDFYERDPKDYWVDLLYDKIEVKLIK